MRIRSTQFFAGGAPLITALVDYAAPNSLVVNLGAEGKQWAAVQEGCSKEFRTLYDERYPMLRAVILPFR